MPPTDDLLVYCWPQSVVSGDDVAIHASGPGVEVAVEIARIGATREVVRRGTMGVQPQALGPEVVAEGCDWPAAAHLTVEPEWRSGYYEVVLTHDGQAPEPVEAVAFFVVRPTTTDPARPLLVLATNTWCAYNDVGGQNLYRSFDVPPSSVVSFRRPMARGFLRRVDSPGSRVAIVGGPDPTMTAHVTLMLEEGYSSWFGSAGWAGWEGPFAAWAEAGGYELDYATNADLVDHPELLDGRRLVLSVGHDEYWTARMRDAIEAFAEDGGNVAFLSGNTACWQVRIEDDGQTLVGYKEAFHDDPVLGTDRQAQLTTLWSDTLLGRPENAMTGVSFMRGGYHRIGRNVGRGAGGYTVQRPEHWVFEGTGVTYGDLIGADAVTVGYECDGCHLEVRDGLPFPTGLDGTPSDFEILGLAPAEHFDRHNALRPVHEGELSEIEHFASRVLGGHDPDEVARLRHGHAVMGLHRPGGTVFTAGTTEWPWGCANRDPIIERITQNLLNRLTSPDGP